MWVVKQENGKFKYAERYVDPYTEKNKTVYVTLNSESNIARNEAQRLLSKKIDDKLRAKTKSKMTVEELLEEWWTQHIKTIRPSSIQSHSKPLKYIKNNMEMDVLISNADVKFFQGFINTLEFSNEYNRKIKGILNMAFGYALDMELIPSNPLSRVKVPTPAVTKESFELVENKFLEKEEVELLLKEYYSTFQSYRHGQLIEFMFLTGMRVGEAISLTVGDFDESEKTINIHGTLDYSSGYKNAGKEMTKTAASYREISLSNRAIEILKDVIQSNEIKHNFTEPTNYIFVGKTGKPIQVNSLNGSLKTMNANLGKHRIKNKQLSSHIFRHSHISLLAELNVPIKAIMERVGHSDEKTTLQIYTHVTKKQKTDIAEKLNNIGL